MIAPMTTTDTHPTAALAATNAGPAKPAGAPVANFNSMRHGLRSTRWPPGCDRAQRENNVFRRALEDAVFAVRGEVCVADAMQINAACEWEKVRQLASRWLRISFEVLKPADRLNYLRESARATTERNKAIEALKIDQPTIDVFNGTLVPGPAVSALMANAAGDVKPENISTGQSVVTSAVLSVAALAGQDSSVASNAMGE